MESSAGSHRSAKSPRPPSMAVEDRTRSVSPKPAKSARSGGRSGSPAGKKRAKSRDPGKRSSRGQNVVPPQSMPASSIGFVPFLKSTKFVDAVLKVRTNEGKLSTFPAHRVVLAQRSQFFDELFTQNRPTELSATGIPMYDLPSFPDHELLHEALGFILWYMYSDELMDISTMPVPERQWDLILGIHRISNMFELIELRSYYDLILRDSLVDPDADTPPDELHSIAVQARRWEEPEIAQSATLRLVEVAGSVDTDELVLAITSSEAFAHILDNVEPSKHFELVRNFVDVKQRTNMPLSPNAAAALWSRVSFERAEIQDLERLWRMAGTPEHTILDAAAEVLKEDPSALSGSSIEFFLRAADHATGLAPSPRPVNPPSESPSSLYSDGRIRSVPSAILWTPSETYTLVRGYIAVHRTKPWLNDAARQDLWDRVQFYELPLEVLQRADVEGIAPKMSVVAALFQKLRSNNGQNPRSNLSNHPNLLRTSSDATLGSSPLDRQPSTASSSSSVSTVVPPSTVSRTASADAISAMARNSFDARGSFDVGAGPGRPPQGYSPRSPGQPQSRTPETGYASIATTLDPRDNYAYRQGQSTGSPSALMNGAGSGYSPAGAYGFPSPGSAPGSGQYGSLNGRDAQGPGGGGDGSGTSATRTRTGSSGGGPTANGNGTATYGAQGGAPGGRVDVKSVLEGWLGQGGPFSKEAVMSPKTGPFENGQSGNGQSGGGPQSGGSDSRYWEHE
ncbi:hypothetical protein M427DRAFT_69708 [Gonapodya prolifera JEL478]|uniref:BTB domain-containing protein n=1 Tax=Gonapodya prolifera (strain JEL478) TaxID=1344416 RepID=A0A139AH41_GONPJ|nr:hypothetical protein M427DRAFT_69708 [Gonapodya prolifera JEL478]|eukprot:KXS16058.1 hypothetical protein M427DRAFT_69708 [Gonapodya prolifera JEL478]